MSLLTPSRVRRLQALAAFGLWAAILVVIVLCLIPGQDVPDIGVGDKYEHTVAYLGLAGLAMIAARSRRQAAVYLVGLVVLGAVIEVLQQFSPGRSPDVMDALADTIGVVVGGLLGWIAVRLLHLLAGAQKSL